MKRVVPALFVTHTHQHHFQMLLHFGHFQMWLCFDKRQDDPHWRKGGHGIAAAATANGEDWPWGMERWGTCNCVGGASCSAGVVRGILSSGIVILAFFRGGTPPFRPRLFGMPLLANAVMLGALLAFLKLSTNVGSMELVKNGRYLHGTEE